MSEKIIKPSVAMGMIIFGLEWVVFVYGLSVVLFRISCRYNIRCVCIASSFDRMLSKRAQIDFIH